MGSNPASARRVNAGAWWRDGGRRYFGSIARPGTEEPANAPCFLTIHPLTNFCTSMAPKSSALVSPSFTSCSSWAAAVFDLAFLGGDTEMEPARGLRGGDLASSLALLRSARVMLLSTSALPGRLDVGGMRGGMPRRAYRELYLWLLFVKRKRK